MTKTMHRQKVATIGIRALESATMRPEKLLESSPNLFPYPKGLRQRLEGPQHKVCSVMATQA